jgi:GYF domain 2
MTIHLCENGKEIGGFSIDQILGMLKSGVIHYHTLAWREGETDWVPLSDLIGTPVPPQVPQRTSMSPSRAIGQKKSEEPRSSLIVRDVIITWGLSLVGGFIAGAVTYRGTADDRLMAVIVSNILSGIAGFCISGCLVAGKMGNRWHHLGYVALGVWLSGVINIFLGFATLGTWLGGIPVTAVLMLLGGGLSFLFKKEGPE